MFCFITSSEKKIVERATLLLIFLEYEPMMSLMLTLSMIRAITTPMFCFITSSEKKIVEHVNVNNVHLNLNTNHRCQHY